MTLHPYLTFDGRCREAFHYYASLLNGRVVGIHTYGEMPGQEPPPGAADMVMHARLEAPGIMLMGSDCPPGVEYEHPRGISLSVHPATIAEAERIYNGLAEGGKVSMPLQQTFWAARFAMVTDRFGIPWMVNCEAEAG